MERVAGIGGFFFRARDPEALGRWYAAHLGVPRPPASYDDPDWWQAEGPTVFWCLCIPSSDPSPPVPLLTASNVAPG